MIKNIETKLEESPYNPYEIMEMNDDSGNSTVCQTTEPTGGDHGHYNEQNVKINGSNC